MKRNLSSHAIKAMAIGMAVAMGSSTAISGVVNGTVVEAFAAVESPLETSTMELSGSDLVISLQAKTSEKFSGEATNTAGLKLTTDEGTTIYTGSEEDTVNNSSGPIKIEVTNGTEGDSDLLKITLPTNKLEKETLNGNVSKLKLSFSSSEIQLGAGGTGKLNLSEIDITGSNLAIDNTSPTIKSASFTGNTITITASENIATYSQTDSAEHGFKIDSSSDINISNVTATGSDKSITITLNKAPKNGEYTISYTPGNTPVKDTATIPSANNLKEGSTTFKVEVGPIIKSQDSKVTEEDSNQKITLVFDENIKVDSEQPVASDFKVLINDVETEVLTLSNIETSATSPNLELTLKDKVFKGDKVKVYYEKSTVEIKDTNDEVLQDISRENAIEIKNEITTEKPIQNEITVKNDVGTYTFKRIDTTGTNTDVMLADFTTSTSKAAASGTLENGVVKVDDKDYKLTQIGDGTNKLTAVNDAALKGHTNNVKTIAANALNGSAITTANFPNVTSVGANALANTNITSADLGSKASSTSIDSTALSNTKKLRTIDTNANSTSDAQSAAKNSGSNNDITISDGNGGNIVVPPTGGGNNGGGSGSSSGSSGGGANIGVSVEDNNQDNNNNNNNNNGGDVTNPTFENKDLTFDAISLPSVDGEPKVFGDIAENHWAKSHIDKLSTAGIINGIDGNFQPNGQTKRADVTIMLVKLLGLSTEGGNRFADVDPNAYYAPYVNTAATYGIVNGSNGMFNPNGIISRQDTMVMIAQILKGLDLNVNTDTTALNQFSDAANVSGYAQESVAILINSGIITGNNGKLNPTAPVTRAEMATIMSKLYDVLASANK